MWGTIINGIQAAGLEHKAMTEASWNGKTIGLLIAYTSAMFILYTVAPILYRMASSAYYNLSLLSSDFYGLLFGLFLFVSKGILNVNRLCVDVGYMMVALQRILAVLYRVRCGPRRSRHLPCPGPFLCPFPLMLID